MEYYTVVVLLLYLYDNPNFLRISSIFNSRLALPIQILKQLNSI